MLREKQGQAATIDQILAAALAGPQLQLDDSAMRALLDIVGDPREARRADGAARDRHVGPGHRRQDRRLPELLKGLADYVARTTPEQLEGIFKQMGHAAGRLSADSMLALLEQREKPDAMVGNIDVVRAVADRMSDQSVAQFVAGSVIAERGATDRLAHAFQALVPEQDRQRQLLALAEAEVAASELGQDQAFSELWGNVEGMLTSYSDASFVSTEYGRELSSARTGRSTVERTSDDPPERVAAWLTTVSDARAARARSPAAARSARHRSGSAPLARHRARPSSTHAEDLVRVGYFDQAWHLAEAVVDQAAADAARQPHARAALDRFGRGVDDEARDRAPPQHRRRGATSGSSGCATRSGTAVIPPLAEALSTEQDARSRRRLRDILIGFGAQGRESVQRLMSSPNWEVRRTAAYLLREFGGTEGLQGADPAAHRHASRWSSARRFRGWC